MFKGRIMARMYRIVVVLLLLSQQLLAQTDSSIFEAPTPFAACEREARRVSEQLSQLKITQYDSIAALLVGWEHQCGTGETSARLDLLLAIADKSLGEKAISAYYEQHLRKFYDRRNFARFNDDAEYYEKHKGYWEFIPLNGRFDRWTAQAAKQLLDSQAAGSDARLLCLLFSGQYSSFSTQRASWAYRDSHTSRYFKDQYRLIYGWEIEKTIFFGSWLPQGRLGEMFHPSPQLNFELSLPIVKDTRGHLAFGFTILQKKQAVRIRTVDSIVDAKTPVSFQFGGGINQRFKLTPKSRLNIAGDVAFNYILTNQKRPAVEPDFNESNYGIGAIDLGLSAGIERNIGERKSLGLTLGLHHVPYGFDRKLITPLGNTYALVGLKMRFW